MRSAVAVLLVYVSVWDAVLGAPVRQRILDLTHIIDGSTLHWPQVNGYVCNKTILEVSGVSVQIEDFFTSTHVGTHMDAPCHFAPGRQTAAEVPLERLVAPAAVVDIREKVVNNPDYELQADELQEWEKTTGHLLNDVVLLIRSGWSKYWSNSTAFMGNSDNDVENLHFPGMSPSAASWLVNNRNVYGVGVETLSLDHGPSTDFQTHVTLNEKNIYALISMASFDELPVFGATLHVMPMKLRGTCGASVRIFATFPDIIYSSEPTKPPRSSVKTRH